MKLNSIILLGILTAPRLFAADAGGKNLGVVDEVINTANWRSKMERLVNHTFKLQIPPARRSKDKKSQSPLEYRQRWLKQHVNRQYRPMNDTDSRDATDERIMTHISESYGRWLSLRSANKRINETVNKSDQKWKKALGQALLGRQKELALLEELAADKTVDVLLTRRAGINAAAAAAQEKLDKLES